MSIADDELRAWAYLARVAEPPCAPVIALVEDLGPIDAADAIRRGRLPRAHAGVRELTSARADADSAAQDLDRASAIDARLVTRADPEWPAWALLALGQADTSVRGGEPLALWVRGPARLDAVVENSIAVVGSRAASSYGEHVTTTLASGLSDRGVAVISGGAYGVDGAAHRAVLAVDGTTVAVLACGIDLDYPAAHSRLLAHIAETGAVVSEYPPGLPAAKHRFLTRNRLVAAFGGATLVVEAGKRSGAANTAAWARKLGRPLGAVPGPITSATSVGCHRMIADELAVLVADVDGAMALLHPGGGPDDERGPRRGTDDLTHDQRRVHDALPARGAMTIAEIAFSAGLDIPAVRSALASLDVGGHVAESGGGWRLSS